MTIRKKSKERGGQGVNNKRNRENYEENQSTKEKQLRKPIKIFHSKARNFTLPRTSRKIQSIPFNFFLFSF